MPASPSLPTAPAAEDTFMAVLVAVGSVLRQRLPGDEHDFSLLPVLAELDRCGPVRHSDLADRLRPDASTVSRRVKQLAEQDLVTVTPDASDARARRVQIRPGGRRALTQLRSRRRDLLGAVMQDWPRGDRDELQRLLSRFLDDLEHHSPKDSTR
jgi:DNA-binding MarR family transcriptional regulator